MERLTAFEFASTTDSVQLVRIKDGDVVEAEFIVTNWLAVALRSMNGHCEEMAIAEFVDRNDLTIEGVGVGRLYWNGELPPWAIDGFDTVAESQRIAQIMRAAREMQNAGSLLAMPS